MKTGIFQRGAQAILLLNLVTSLNAKADFEKVLSCQGGAASVDVDTNDRRHLQLVIRDREAIAYLQGFVRFGQNEMIIRGQTEYGLDFNSPTGPKIRYNGNSKRVFGPQDFSYLLNLTDTNDLNRAANTSFQSVYRNGEELKVEFLNLKGYGCAGQQVSFAREGVFNSFCQGESYTGIEKLRDWAFKDCH